MKILVINRQEKGIGQILSVVESVNGCVNHYSCGLDGLMAARVERFDLIVSHTDLPVITGFELIRSLRHSSINKNTPVIFLVEEITSKVNYLGNLLGATAIVEERNWESLEENIKNHVKKYEAARASDLQSLFQTQNLN